MARHHTAGEPTHHRADPQLRPAPGKNRLTLREKPIDRREIVDLQVVQAFGSDL